MRVFVTGAAGYIGSVVTELLVESGHEVVAYDCLKSGHRSAVHPLARFVQGDILDSEALSRALEESRADAAMHFASEIVVSESYRDPGLHFRVNTLGSLELLEAMRKSNVRRLVFSSSAAVYGEPSGGPLAEDHPCAPLSPYGESKLQVERMLRWYGEVHGLRHVSLRYFNACGATERHGEDRPFETHLIPILIDVARGARSGFKLYGNDYPTPDGTCIRDYVHVCDIARAHIMVLEALDRLEFHAYNLGTGSGKSNLEVLKAVEKASGRPIACDLAPRRQGDPAVLTASAERIRRELGWQPEFTDLDSMVASAWNWRIRHPGGYER
jgi:UDP-glucose 4-epimerase